MRDDQLETGSSEPLHNGSSAAGLAAAPTAGMSLADDSAGEADHPIPVKRAASNEAAAADSESALIVRRVTELQCEHAALDTLIAKLIALRGANDFELRRLKKRKLKVKDTIMLLQLQLEPDARA
jgi:hypothetical protein